MESIRNIAVAGISSRLALQVCQELLRDPAVRIRGSSRDLSRLPEWIKQSAQIEIIQAAADNTESLCRLVKGCEVVICCYLANNKVMEEAQKLLIDVAEAEGVERYIASDYTLDYTKLNFGGIECKDPMKTIHAYLKAKPKIKGVHILVGIFMELFWEFWAPWDSTTSTISYWGDGNGKWECMRYNDVARYVAAVARDPTANGILKFLGDRKSIHELAEDLFRIHAVRPTPKCLGSLDSLFEQAHRHAGQQDILAAGAYYELSGQCSLGHDLDNNRYPRIKPQSFSEFLESHSPVALQARGAAAFEEREFRN